MPAYILVEIEIHDKYQYEEYKKMTPATLLAYGGRFIVRGGESWLLEGDSQPNRIVVLEFPSMEKAKQWWASEEYAPAKALRHRIATTRMIAVQGV